MRTRASDMAAPQFMMNDGDADGEEEMDWSAAPLPLSL